MNDIAVLEKSMREIILSDSQSAVLYALKKEGKRFLPYDAVWKFDMKFWWQLHCWAWAWSWDILQSAKTADYRRRIHELNQLGYQIVSFHVSYSDNGRKRLRHGYVLVAEPGGGNKLVSGK